MAMLMTIIKITFIASLTVECLRISINLSKFIVDASVSLINYRLMDVFRYYTIKTHMERK